MRIRKPSHVASWSWVYPFDEALARPERADGESQADFRKRVTDFEDELERALDAGTPLPVKPDAEEKPAIWTLRQLSGKPLAFVMRQLFSDDSEAQLVADLAVVAYCLEAVDGLLDEDGEPFELGFKRDAQLKIRRLDDDTIAALAEIGGGLLVRLMAAAVIARSGDNAKKKSS